MRRIVFLVVMSWVLFSSFTIVHKYYVSVTQIEYNQEEQSLQIISRLFVDDIEDLLKERYDPSIVLGQGEEKGNVDKYLKQYFEQKLHIKIEGKKSVFNFLGKEYEDDQLLFYLEIEQVSSFDSVEVINEILMDLFSDQQNIIHVKKGKEKKSVVLEKGQESMMLKFSK